MKFQNVSRLAALGFAVAVLLLPQVAFGQVWAWKTLPDPRGEFVRLCAPHMVGRSNHPESVCVCLHDYALATIADPDLHDALMRGISETGVPAIENAWIPAEKRQLISNTFNIIARPTFQCMFAPRG